MYVFEFRVRVELG